MRQPRSSNKKSWLKFSFMFYAEFFGNGEEGFPGVPDRCLGNTECKSAVTWAGESGSGYDEDILLSTDLGKLGIS